MKTHICLLVATAMLANGPAVAEPPAFMPRMKPIPIPPSSEDVAGMKVIQSQEDSYVATYLPNVIYSQRGDTSLRLQIVMPRRAPAMPGPQMPTVRRPLIVFVQGSGWGPQDLYTAIPQLAELAHRGFVVASVEYRPSTVAKAPAQIQDVKTAIRFLRANAANYDIDPDRVGIWGDSSGGHMAALVGVTEGVQAFETTDYAPQSDAVRAVVDFYGVSDFSTLGKYPSWLDHDAPDSPGALLLGAAPPTVAEIGKAQSPNTYISKSRLVPPFLIIHGDADAIVPFHQSVELFNRLRAAGKDATFYKVAGGNHGIRFWTPGIVDLVANFFSEKLAP